MKVHKSITFERIQDILLNDDCTGICIDCGEEVMGVEPDARGYTCDCCGAPAVYGAEELLITGAFHDR
jgi:hypothetical protein